MATKAILAIEGPSIRWPSIDFSIECTDQKSWFTICGRHIVMQPASIRGTHTVQTAATIWDCSIVMAKWIESQSVKISGRVLELGAGRGLVSMACRSLGCSISATDMPEALEILQETFNVNDFKDIAVAPLDWKDSKSPLFEKRFDYIVAADVVWVHELIAPLVSTLARMHIFTIGLVSGDTIAFVAHQSRSQRSDNEFFSSLQKNNLSWIALNLGDTIYQKPSCQILHITLKLDSSPTAA